MGRRITFNIILIKTLQKVILVLRKMKQYGEHKMVSLFYTCRNVTGKFSRGLLHNMKILEIKNSKFDFLTPTKTDQSKIFIEEYLDVKINKSINLFSEFYENIAIHKNSWKEVYDTLDVSELQNYDSYYIIGGLHYPQSNITRFSSRSNIFPNDRGQIKFRQTGIHILNILAIYKAHVTYDIPLHEFSYDTDEMSVSLFQIESAKSNFYSYHIYDIPKYGMKRLDSLQYYYKNKNNFFNENEKIFELTFGYTVYDYGNRESFISWINSVSKNTTNSNLYVKNNITGEDNSIDFDLYLDKISKSKYTLIIPSYDNNCFSLYRFIEAIYRDCLPLIHDDCFCGDVEKSFDVDLSELKLYKSFTEKRRIEMLEYMKNKFLKFERGFS